MRLRLRGQWAFLLSGYIATCIVVIAIAVYNNQLVAHGMLQVRKSDFPAYKFVVRLESKVDLFSGTLNEAVLTGDEEMLRQASDMVPEVNTMVEHSLEYLFTEHQIKLRNFKVRFDDYVKNVSQLAKQLILADTLALSDQDVEVLAKNVSEERKLLDYMLQELVNEVEGLFDKRVEELRDRAQQNIQQIIILAVIILFTFTALAMINIRGMIASLQNLARATMSFGEGEAKLIEELNDQRPDEVGELAQSFKRMTNVLHETTVSKDYVNDIMNSVAETLLVVGDNKSIETANKSAHEILGYKEGDLYARHIYELIDSEAYETLLNELAEQPVVTMDIPIGTSDGTLIEMSVSASNMQDGAYGVKRTVLIGQDVSERRRQERELKESKIIAENLVKSKSEFLANMSHELRTPLNGVLGMAQLLNSTDLNREQFNYVNTISGSGEHLLSLINDVLDFSKIEAGQMKLDIGRFHLRDMVENTISMLAGSPQRKEDVELMVYYDGDLADEYMGDITRIRQILVNFVGNAMKFTERGYLVISAKWIRSLDQHRTVVRLEVADSGIGIPEDKLESVFDVFSQADGSTTRKFGGTGLGLAISKQIALLMQGEIGVSSQLGVGSTFYVDIPMVPCDIVKKEASVELPLAERKVILIHPLSKACAVYMQQIGDWGADIIAVRNVDDLQSRLRFFNKDQPINIIADGDVFRHYGEGLADDLRNEGYLVERYVVLSEIGQEKTYDTTHDLTRVVSKPVFRDVLIKAITGSSKGTSFYRTIIDVAESSSVGSHVLLVEDNKVNQRVAVAMLEKLGHTVETAENGEEAVKMVQMDKYDVVLMDCQMPVLDGWEATKKIRGLSGEFLTLPIVALTANALSGDRERCLEAGMSDYLSKPVRRQELKEMIEKVSSKARTN